MPRFITLIFSLVVCSILSSCGSPSSEAPPPASPEGAAQAARATNETNAPTETDPARAFEGLPEPYNTADYARGRRTFKLCSTCHTVTADGPNVVGPNLHGIIGREAGSLSSFSYSKALREATFTWTPEHIDEWLANPNSYLPGNNMSFSGVRKPDDRIAVIAYLMVESGYAPPADEESAPR